MRLLPLVCALFLLTLSAAPQARAQSVAGAQPPFERTITVSGNAEVRVVPDEVLVSMAAETRGPDLLAAQKENDRAVGALIAYTTETLGVEDKHIQTDRVRINPVHANCLYDDELNGRCDPLKVVYYSVRKNVQIRLEDPESYEPLVTKALQLGITHLDSVQFATTELRKHRDRAREMAAQASREKAQAVASTLGVTVGKPITIRVDSPSVWFGGGGGEQSDGAKYRARRAPPAPRVGRGPGPGPDHRDGHRARHV